MYILKRIDHYGCTSRWKCDIYLVSYIGFFEIISIRKIKHNQWQRKSKVRDLQYVCKTADFDGLKVVGIKKKKKKKG